MLNDFFRGMGDAKGASPREPGYFIKWTKKIGLFVDFGGGAPGGFL
jgi:hypothetical protein